MHLNTKQLLYGMSTCLPGLSRFHAKGTGGLSARYCYAVWLRHLVMAGRNGLLAAPPKTVGELGPGDSVGIGLAALLSGAEMYYGMDVVQHASLPESATLLDELAALFKRRESIPNPSEFSAVEPSLDSYAFPFELLTDQRLAASLSDDRIDRIRQSLDGCEGKAAMIRYAAPWYGVDSIRRESCDMILSQAVLEHVDDLPTAYRAMRLWLRPGGHISHEIDFGSHGLTDQWNGHWACSDLAWRLMRGRRAYLLNRQPHSTHVRLLEESGFAIRCDQKVKSPSALGADQLATAFRDMPKEDLTIRCAFIQAVVAPLSGVRK